ncbi:MAG: hypothetical protein PVJ92_00565, partial [Candidatus Dependentiae bacterium]
MTHAPRLLSRTVIALMLLGSGTLFADAIDDAITTHTATYDAQVTVETEMRPMWGDDRKDQAAETKATLDTLITNIQRVIDNSDGLGVPSAGQNTSLTTLKTNAETLRKRVADHEFLGTLHGDVAAGLEILGKVDIENSQTTNLTHLSSSISVIDSRVDNVNSIHTANEVGIGTVGALEHVDSLTEFNAERTRILHAQELTDLVQAMLSK